jgi:hypothetical protein
MREIHSPPTFADIALALMLASPKLQRDIDRMVQVAERISLSQMGLEVTIADLKRDMELIASAVLLFKEMAEVEPQVRAVLARQASRQWVPQLVVAV